MFFDFFLSGILQGLILAFAAFGMMLSFRLLNFPDLTIEGSYPLGASICAMFLILNINPFISLLIGAILSGFIGICTAFIHLKYKINTLLAGIILSTMIYSLNLRIMGKPNLALFEQSKIFLSENIFYRILTILFLFILLVIPIISFLKTEKGLQFRAVGLNPNFALRQSIFVNKYIYFGLFLGNFCCGLAGGLIVQVQSYVDIGMGVGIAIHALAALMIGESVLGNSSLLRQVLSPFIGALIYQQIQGIALFIGFAPSDLKLLTGFIVLLVIALQKKNLQYSKLKMT